MGEVWKRIFEEYEVSNTGRIKSLKFSKERILKEKDNGLGYLQVVLSINGKQKTYNVHKLVAEAFIPNPNNLPQVNHINGDKKDNRVDNLEWVSNKENIIHSFKNNLNKTNKPVVCIETGEEYYSCCEAMRNTKIDHSLISKVCRGKRKTAGGYHWQYKDTQ